jgi:putative peptidoglycan lipid II flippase
LVAVIFFFLRVPLLRLCFERGAFDSAMTRGVSNTLPWMLVGSVAMLGSVIAFRNLYGQSSQRMPALLGIATPALYFALSSIFTRLLGFQGICVAYATCWWTVLLGVLVKLFGFRLDRILAAAASLRPLAGALSVASFAVWALSALFLSPGRQLGDLAVAFRCLAVAATGFALFAIMPAFVWPVPEVQRLIVHLRGRWNRTPA